MRALPPAAEVRLLINNVGVSTRIPAMLIDQTRAEVSGVLAVNLVFTVKLTHRLLPRMIDAAARLPAAASARPRSRSGIVFVSSLAGLVVSALCSVYGATKAALVSFSRTLSAELAGDARGARMDVHCLCPSYVNCGNTPIWTGANTAMPPDQVAAGMLRQLGSGAGVVVCPTLAQELSLRLLWIAPAAVVGWGIRALHTRQREALLQGEGGGDLRKKREEKEKTEEKKRVRLVSEGEGSARARRAKIE